MAFDWSGVAAAGVGGGLGLLGSVGSALFGRSSQKSAMKAQYNYALKFARNQPSAQREGLEAAGYNPMLALSGGSASFMPSAQMPSVQAPDIAGSAKDAYELKNLMEDRAKLENDKIRAETTRTEVGTWMDVLGPLAGLLGGAILGRNSNKTSNKSSGKMPSSFPDRKPGIPDIPLNIKDNPPIPIPAALLKKTLPILLSAPLIDKGYNSAVKQTGRELSDPKIGGKRRFRGARLGNVHLQLHY